MKAETVSEFSHGWLTKQTWVDENKVRVMNDDGYSYFVRKLDGAFRPLSVTYYDTQDNRVNMSAGYAEIRTKFSGYGWVLEQSYWGADYQDPATYTDPFRLGQKYNYMWMADGYAQKAAADDPAGRQSFDGGYWKNYIYEQQYNEAAAEHVDLAKRYEALANLEAWLIDTAIVTPFSVGGVGYCVAYYNPFELALDPFGISDDRFKNIYIYKEAMGIDAYEEALAVWLDEKAAAIAASAK
ncbi:MAG: hypothetical protein EOM58_01990 [Clostridia bacterium]|nr:hypothetical protein [Clostridia bacterium]